MFFPAEIFVTNYLRKSFLELKKIYKIKIAQQLKTTELVQIYPHKKIMITTIFLAFFSVFFLEFFCPGFISAFN